MHDLFMPKKDWRGVDKSTPNLELVSLITCCSYSFLSCLIFFDTSSLHFLRRRHLPLQYFYCTLRNGLQQVIKRQKGNVRRMMMAQSCRCFCKRRSWRERGFIRNFTRNSFLWWSCSSFTALLLLPLDTLILALHQENLFTTSSSRIYRKKHDH